MSRNQTQAFKGIGAMRANARAVLGCLFVIVVGGCATQHPTDLRPIQAMYNAGDYNKAYAQAHAVSDSPLQPLATRQEAAYFAGLAANRVGNLDQAQQELTFAATSPDKSLASDAKATLGLVFTQQGRFGLASDNLLDAARAMKGQDRANAFYYGGIAQQKMGRWPESRISLSEAMSNSRDPAFRAAVAAQLKITGYTLQTGAYEVSDHARDMASTLADRVAQMHLGAPRIVPSVDPDSKRRLFLVQVGQFTSWPTALAARERLALSSSIVVPLSMR